MAEDTWALNDGAIDETDFLTQAYSYGRARSHVRRTRSPIQGAAWWPASSTPATASSTCSFAISMATATPWPASSKTSTNAWTALVGKALEHLDDDTILFALSDHGFCAFRRAVNLNSWLHQNGYLALTEERPFRPSIGPHARLLSRPQRPVSQPAGSRAPAASCNPARGRRPEAD